MGDISIGLVDDHSMLRQGLAMVLNSEEGMKVVLQADCGDSFLEMLTEEDSPDVAIVDINMNGMQGFELVKLMTASYPETKLIALSMRDDEKSIIKMIKNGARGYVLKGSDPEELINAIKITHNEGYCYNDMVSRALVLSVTVKPEEELKGLEIEFLKLCCNEMSYKEIATKMNKAPSTIDNYRAELFAKLDVTSRVGLVLYAMKNGIFKIEP